MGIFLENIHCYASGAFYHFSGQANAKTDLKRIKRQRLLSLILVNLKLLRPCWRLPYRMLIRSKEG